MAGGKSVDTSMGFTPLEGLVMGTRCGNIDPALVPYIMEREKLGTKEIDSIMNKNSGMLGLTETSNDMREIEQEAARGSERHRLAIDIYCYSDQEVHRRLHGRAGRRGCRSSSPAASARTPGSSAGSSVAGLDDFGIDFDAAKNESNERVISSGKVKIMVVPTNEELAIARDTRRILQSTAGPRPAARKRSAANGPQAVHARRDGPARPALGPEPKRTLRPGQRNADARALAGRVAADAIQKELERLNLTRPPVTRQERRQQHRGKHHG